MTPDLILLFLAVSGDRGIDDTELARRIREGDRKAFKTFFESHKEVLFGFLRRRNVPPDDARDIIQNAYLTIWERRSEIDENKSLRSYLFRISYTRALNHFRDNVKFTTYNDEVSGKEPVSGKVTNTGLQPGSGSGEESGAGSGPGSRSVSKSVTGYEITGQQPPQAESQTDLGILQKELNRIVATLPEKRRAVFELCFMQELTYREAAEILGVSKKTVENHMGMALKTVREGMEGFHESGR